MPPETRVRTARLATLAQAVFGDDWRSRLGETMLVNASTVWRWSAGAAPIPEAVFVALECLAKEKR